MLQFGFMDNLDPTYQHLITELKYGLNAAEDNEERLNLLSAFSCAYVLPKELWNAYFGLIIELLSAQEIRERAKSIILHSFYQLYYKTPTDFYLTLYYCGPLQLPKRKLLKYGYEPVAFGAFNIGNGVSPNAASLIRNISFPSAHIETTWRQYEKTSMPPLKVVKMYQKMKALYAKIEMVKENVEEWLEALMEVGDSEFVEHNIEYRLGSDLSNKKLWKLYIEYLKEQQEEGDCKLLHTYSKYCRFFMDDTKMKEEYQKAAEKYSHQIEVPWTNPFEFEVFSEAALKHYFSKSDDTSASDNEEEANHIITVYFNTDNLIEQKNLTFKSPLIHYIIQNANARILQNLFKCCKWFFANNPIPICYSLKTKQRPMRKSEINFYQQSVEVVEHSLVKTGLENIYLSTVLQIINPRDRMLLSDFIPKMFKCDAKYISITNQDLTFNELYFILGHGNVFDLHLYEVGIIDGNGKAVPIEDVLKLCLKAQFINIGGVSDTPNTAKILSEMKFENKFEIFNLKIDDLESNAFAEFLKKNMAPNSEILIHYKFNNNAPIISNFRQIVSNAINSHWKADEKPTFKVI
uniref:Uncharacterized protein n=1 Tax=Panagrolaimus davidi TaxID=227884 RepID=A0A914PZB3_9BILA